VREEEASDEPSGSSLHLRVAMESSCLQVPGSWFLAGLRLTEEGAGKRITAPREIVLLRLILLRSADPSAFAKRRLL
jgi:hypothetical protein